MKKLAYAISVLMMPILSHSEIIPKQGKTDPRIRVIDYDPMQVVNYKAYYGVAGHIQFEKGEEIVEAPIGDDAAWNMIPKLNHMFLKPKSEHADTNMIVVTNKRTYNFVLTVLKKPLTDDNTWTSPDLVYTLIFRYPDTDEKKREEEENKIEEIEAKEEIKERFQEVKQRVFNNDYWVRGDMETTPTSAHDDGNFVYLYFDYNKDLPVPYSVNDSGESKVNYHVEGNSIIISGLDKHYMLRKGDQVAELVTNNATIGVAKDSGTIDSSVIRELKNGE